MWWKQIKGHKHNILLLPGLCFIASQERLSGLVFHSYHVPFASVPLCVFVCALNVRVCVYYLREEDMMDVNFCFYAPDIEPPTLSTFFSVVRAASIRCRCLYFLSHKCQRRHFETSFLLVIACMKLCFLRALNRFYLICHFSGDRYLFSEYTYFSRY